MVFYFENTKTDIIMTGKDEDSFRNITNCRFCEKNIESDKVRDQYHLTGKNRRRAQNACNINVTQKQSSFLPFVVHTFMNYDLFKKN